YLEGQTLAERLQRGALPIDRLIRYSLAIADALDQAHRSGIVHRDLKPANIILTASGIKLLDFGLAKLRPRGAIAGLTDALTQPPLDRLVSRCLAKDPDDRWQNARDLFLELRALPMSEAPSAAMLGRFTKWLVAGALALALIITASVGFVLRTFSSPERTATP